MSVHTISPLYSHLASQIDDLIESVEFDETVHVLDGVKSALITACDPLNTRNGGSEFSRVMLVLQTMSALISHGVISPRGSDNDRILALCDISKLPTDL